MARVKMKDIIPAHQENRGRERERKIERNPAHYKRHTSHDGSPGQWILYKDQRILKRSIPSIVSQLQLHACVSRQSSGVFYEKKGESSNCNRQPKTTSNWLITDMAHNWGYKSTNGNSKSEFKFCYTFKWEPSDKTGILWLAITIATFLERV